MGVEATETDEEYLPFKRRATGTELSARTNHCGDHPQLRCEVVIGNDRHEGRDDFLGGRTVEKCCGNDCLRVNRLAHSLAPLIAVDRAGLAGRIHPQQKRVLECWCAVITTAQTDGATADAVGQGGVAADVAG